jgi:hypothetical protein
MNTIIRTRSAWFFPRHRTHPACYAPLALFMLAGLSLARPPSAAADIVYTWVEDDATPGLKSLTGSLDVRSAAQSAGAIAYSDVVSSTLNDPFGFPYEVSTLNSGSFPLQISTVNAAPDSSNDTIAGIPTNTDPYTLTYTLSIVIAFDQNWNVIGGEHWTEYINGTYVTESGVGHWEISATVPEPSTLVLGITSLAGLGIITLWKRWTRPAPGR